jgi:hypothetical protein
MDLPEDVSGADLLNIRSAGFCVPAVAPDGRRSPSIILPVRSSQLFMHRYIFKRHGQIGSKDAGIRVILHAMDRNVRNNRAAKGKTRRVS